MANYINLINVGGVIYDIGMKNAARFYGISPITNFYVDEDCETAAGNTNIGADFLYTKGLSLNDCNAEQLIDEIYEGAMVIPSRAGECAGTTFEYICVQVVSGRQTSAQIAKWAMMGETKTQSGTITTSVAEKTGAMVDDVTYGTASVVTSVAGDGAASAIPSSATLATANYTILTDAPAIATAHKVGTQSVAVATGVDSTSMVPVTNVTIGTAGSITPSSAAFVSGVSGGAVSTTTGSFVTAAVGSVTTATGSVITGVSGGTIDSASASVVTSLSSTNVATSVATGTIAHVTDHVLTIEVAAVTAAGTTAASALASSGNVVKTVTQAPMTVVDGTVVTSISTAAADKAAAVTGISQSDLTVDTANALTAVSYADPTLKVDKSASVTIVTSLKTKDVNVVTSLSDVAAVTAIPTADKPVATAFGSFTAVPVISNVVVSSADVINSISVSTKTIATGITESTGTVLTAAV